MKDSCAKKNLVKPLKTTNVSSAEVHSLPHFLSFAETCPFNGHDIVSIAKSVEMYGTSYSEGMVIVLEVGDLMPTFGKIVHIVMM